MSAQQQTSIGRLSQLAIKLSRKLISHIFALLVFVVACASLAHAQTAQRTFVSAQRGSDANTASLCSIANPCRGFSAAISVVSPNGEVIVLDSGGYGAVTISKSVQLIAPTGVYAAITATSGNAITISTGVSDTVVLRGLTFNGLGAQRGIDFQTGRTLHIESCVINGFSNTGINVARDIASDTAEVFIKDTIVRSGLSAILLNNTGANSIVRASIDNCRMERNRSGNGLYAGDNSRVTVRGSVSANNQIGFISQTTTSGSTSELNLESCVSTNNSLYGLYAYGSSGTTAIIRVSNSTITDNLSGVQLGSSTAQILSRGNNTVEGNASGNDFPTGSTYTAK